MLPMELNQSKENQLSGEYLFSDETIQSLEELGSVLRRIHARLIAEGYSIIGGRLISPIGEVVYERKF